jgi:hypothetical protein
LPGKAKTPSPPRRVQAPKTRKEHTERRGTWLIVAALVALAVVGAAGAYLLLRDTTSPSEDVAQAMRSAGCTYQTYPGLPAGVHISNPNATPQEWNSNPPTSGPHFGQWVIWGEYDEPVRLAESVHNLEHGGIVMFYGPQVPQEEVSKLRSFYREDATAMLLAPLPSLGDKISLSAWYDDDPSTTSSSQGILAQCTAFDENAFRAFRDAYRFKGPERIPPESLQPGS